PDTTSSPRLMKVERSANGTQIFTQFTIKLARLSHVLAALPEIELGSPKYITRIRKNWLIAFNQAPNVVGVSMCDDNNVDVLWHVSRSRESRDHLSGRKSLAELIIFARKRAVAGVEQHQLLAGVHKRWNIGMLEPSGVDIVGSRKGLYFVSGGISTVMRVQSFADCFGIQNGSDLEPAELETVNCGLQFAFQ